MSLFKYKNVTLDEAKNRLFWVWAGGAVFCFAITFFQTIFNKYDDLYMNVVGWFGPLIIPTLTLMIGVVAAGRKEESEMKKTEADSSVFIAAELGSILFLAAIIFIFLIEPVMNETPFDLMGKVKVIFAAIDGVLTGLIGYFFIKK